MNTKILTFTQMSATDFADWNAAERRRRSGEVDFGCHWVLKDEAVWSAAQRWRLSWIEATGELYAAAQGNGIQWGQEVSGQLCTTTIIAPSSHSSIGLVFAGKWRTRAAIEEYLAGWADAAMFVEPLANSEAQLELRHSKILPIRKRG